MLSFKELRGTLSGIFQIGLNAGLNLKVAAGRLLVRNTEDDADAPLQVSELFVSGERITLNDDAAGSGADWKTILERAASGQTADVTLKLPADAGTAGYGMFVGPAGQLYFGPAAAGTNMESTDTTDLVFGSASPVAMFQLPANAVVLKIRLIVDTPFDGTPSASIGVAGTPSKFMAATQLDLTQEYTYEVTPDLPAEGSAQDLIITYAAGGATVGAARVLVTYCIPS